METGRELQAKSKRVDRLGKSSSQGENQSIRRSANALGNLLMSMSQAEYLQVLTRLDKNKVREKPQPEAKWVCKNGSKPMDGAPSGHGPYVTPGNCPECGIPLVPLNSRESNLHDSIIDYCNSQWPKWKYLHSRMDKRTTLAVGSQDFTIFMPGGRLLCVECKRAGEKPTQEQLAWAKEMEMLQHKVHVVTSFEQFLNVVDGR